MSNEKGASEFHKRLDDLEKRIAKKKAEIGQSNGTLDHHDVHVDELYARAKKVRAKLSASDESNWSAMKDEIEADWLALKANFENWINGLDEKYRHRKF